MLKLFHAPMSRSGSILWLLEELGVPYELEIVDIRAEGGAPESYRAIHPHKKVPAIVHDGVAITERSAICIYLADAFPAAGLAPPIGDPRRGPYLSWLAYNDGVMDPAFGARMAGWEYQAMGASFGKLEDVRDNLEDTLWNKPFLTGETFTAADLLVSGAVNWAVNFMKILPETPALLGFLERTMGRPAFAQAMAKDRG